MRSKVLGALRPPPCGRGAEFGTDPRHGLSRIRCADGVYTGYGAGGSTCFSSGTSAPRPSGYVWFVYQREDVPNTRADEHLCNPLGTSFRPYRHGVSMGFSFMFC